MVDQPIELAPSDTQPEIPQAFITAGLPENENPVCLPQEESDEEKQAEIEWLNQRAEQIDFDDLGPMTDDEKHAWRIDGPGTAAWALSKYRYYHGRATEVQDVYAAERARLEKWREAETEKLVAPMAFFATQLQLWHAAVYAADHKRKSISYPAGTIKRREGSESVVIDDESTFLDWATREADLFVRIPEPKMTVAKDEIKKAIKTGVLQAKDNGELFLSDSGEALPGVLIERSEPIYKIELTETAD